MPYVKSSLIAKPVESAFGVSEALGLDWGDIGGGVSSALSFFGQGLKAQGAQEALSEQMKAQAAMQAQQQAASGGIPTTYLVVGGLALAGLLVFAMRRK